MKGFPMSEELPTNPVPAAAAVPAPAVTPVSTVAYEDFAKLDLRIGKVLEVANHPNADKLFVLKVDLGGEQRQIIAGLRPFCPPESLLGKLVVVVANLLPRKMRGLESAGMILAASYEENAARHVVILTPDQPVPPGSKIS
jgi:methionyl-tRNA synthetase